jgi:hypothetical protein
MWPTCVFSVTAARIARMKRVCGTKVDEYRETGVDLLGDLTIDRLATAVQIAVLLCRCCYSTINCISSGLGHLTGASSVIQEYSNPDRWPSLIHTSTSPW